jgi:hypothetical protein
MLQERYRGFDTNATAETSCSFSKILPSRMLQARYHSFELTKLLVEIIIAVCIASAILPGAAGGQGQRR